MITYINQSTQYYCVSQNIGVGDIILPVYLNITRDIFAMIGIISIGLFFYWHWRSHSPV